MKKIFYFPVIALLFAAFTFTSCEDVPMPYDMPTDPNTTTGESGEYYLKESFASGFGDFTVVTTKGTPWVISYSCATGTGYDSSTGASTESESYLVSKEVDLSAATEVYLQFDYIFRYGTRSGTANKVYITSAYTGDPTTTSWTDITGTLTEGSDWSTFYTYAINIPSGFIGKSGVVVALYYACGTSSATWEVKNLVMADGTAEDASSDGDGGGSGEGNTSSADNPYTVSELLPLINALASGGTIDDVYVKGIVSEITEISPSYGNMTYYISDDGTTANQLLIYRGKSLNNAAPTSSNEIKVGDEVIVYGQFVNYYGNTPEGAQGNTYIYSLNGSGGSTSGDGTGSGTVSDPYDTATAIALISALASNGTIENIYVKGIISLIDEISTSYGNATYYISDDGTTANQLCIYRGYSLGNAKFTSTSEIKVGDEVVVYGTFTNYYGNTPEGAQGNTYIYSLNGVTADDGGSTGGTSEGVNIDGSTVTLVNGSATPGTETAYINLDVGLDNGTSVEGQTFTFDDGSTVTFAKNGGSTAPTYYTATKGIRVYAMNTMTFTCSKKIATIYMTCDVYQGTNEVGNDTATVEFSDTGAVYCNYHTSTSSGTQLRVQTITITYAE